MTTKAQIAAWFREGAQKGAKNMIVVCDTFDHEDYPVYTYSGTECIAKVKSPGNMQRVMEVYDLHSSEEGQLKEVRAMRLPKEND